MNEKWYKEKYLIYAAAISIPTVLLGLILMYSNSLFNLQEMYTRHYAFFRYCPQFVSDRFWRLSIKQSNMRRRDYRENVYVREFFKLYSNARFSFSTMPDDSDGTLECRAIVYGRYLLTMRVRFIKNLTQTGISSYDPPECELVELKSLVNIGKPNSWGGGENVVSLCDKSGSRLQLTTVGEKISFGVEKWNRLKDSGGDFYVLFSSLKKESPLKMEYDYTKTIDSATKGNDEAIQCLILAYLKGKGVPKDYGKAFVLCEKLAKKRYIGRYFSSTTIWAMKCLGIMYLNGFGVEKNPEKAYKWLLGSARCGNVFACGMLGSMNERGVGCPKDEKNAIVWYRRGVAKNDPNSQNGLAYIWAEKGENLTEAEKLVEAALASKPDNAFFLDTLGWIYYKQGRYGRAVDSLDKAFSLRKGAVVAEHLAVLYAKLGKKDKADEFWRKALDLADKNDKETINSLKCAIERSKE